MKCKYVEPGGLVIKYICEKPQNIHFEKISCNKYNIKDGEHFLAVFVSKKYVRFIKELLWKLSFIPKDYKI